MEITQETIKKAANKVPDVRAKHTCQTLAWRYNPETMPANLQADHDALNMAVDAARAAFLFGRYLALTAATAPVADTEPASKKPARKKAA